MEQEDSYAMEGDGPELEELDALCASADPTEKEMVREAMKEVVKALDRAVAGSGAPTVTVRGPEPTNLGPSAGRWAFYHHRNTFTSWDLRKFRYLLPGGKVPCPACRSGASVESTGPQFERIRPCVAAEGNHYLLSWGYRCKKCPGAAPALLQRSADGPGRAARPAAQARALTAPSLALPVTCRRCAARC